MTPALPAAFLGAPIAHRALHGPDRPENSREAIRAAVEAGYGIEIDLQPSSDGVAMVFHDDRLDRMTEASGPTHAQTAEALQALVLKGGPSGIPTFAEVLALVAGRVPLLVELKDQECKADVPAGTLERATAEALAGYTGPVALMSFQPQAMARMQKLCPDLPRGLTTCDYSDAHFDDMPQPLRDHLNAIADFDRVGASFVSHQWGDLARPRVAELAAQGAAILSWTIRSPEEEAKAREIAQNVTFEHYAAAIPA